MQKSDKPIIVEQTFNSSIDRVWKAITDVNLMRKWYFPDISSFKPETGFETQFNVKNQGRNFLHKWKVIEVLPLEKITYKWEYGGYRGDSLVKFELLDEKNLIRLRLTHKVLEDFPQNIP
jgi:uncharacterized protein YndB with AHSA1/START domain